MVTINTNISALVSQSNLGKADKLSQSSIARLSSGNRIIRAADDAAGLAIGTGLRTDVSSLRTALTNTSQANSLLSLADGALTNIGEILQRQKALASQSNSGSLSGQERIFLDQEFQNLTLEIDRIAGSTNFNGINLLDGSISGTAGLTTDTSGSDAKHTASVTFAAAPGVADANHLTIAGITFSTDATATNLNASATGIEIFVDAASGVNGIDTTTGTGFASAVAYVINNIETLALGITSQAKIDALKGLSASSNGETLTLTSKNSGAAGAFVVSKTSAAVTAVASISAGTVTVAGAINGVTSVASSTTAVSGSLGDGAVTASGTVGNAVLTAIATTAATLTNTFVTGDLDNNDTFTAFGRQFTLKDTVTDTATQIQRGTTDKETIANIASFLNASVDPTLSRFTYEVPSEALATLTLTVTAKTNSAKFTTDFDFTDMTDTVSLTAGAGGGVDVSTITDNAAFVGEIGGFTASYAGADAITLSVKIGDYTYQGKITDTTPGADTAVRLYSTDSSGAGGYFTINLANGQGSSVTSQSDANTYVQRINDAFASLDFQQTRSVESFETDGTMLEGGRIYFKSESFESGLEVSSVVIRQATSTNSLEGSATITLSDGRVFEDTTLGRKIHAGEKITLVNRDNTNETITMYAGSNGINLDSATDVASFQADLENGLNSGGGGLDFQVGVSATDTIALTVTGVNTATLFDGLSLNILTVDSAIAAGEQLDLAIDNVTALRSQIGSLQSRFDFAAANLQTSIQNTDAARADFLDDDVAKTATEFAKAQVLLQASISVLAQANQLPQNLLKLIG
jgi:flagellin